MMKRYKRVGVGIAHTVTRFFACELSLADILFLSGHAQKMIKHATKEKEKNFLKDCISMVKKLKTEWQWQQRCSLKRTKKLWAGVHLQLFDSWRKLVEELTGETTKLVFEKFIVAIKNQYTTLLKVHVKGKRSVQFQQAWLCHIKEYFQPSLHYTQS